MSNAGITKTCVICGLIKPLSAFLQLGEGGGALYGNICATCRSTQKSAPLKKEGGDSTTSTTGKELDSKAKVELEKEKRQLRQDMVERNQEEAAEKEQVQTKLVQKTENISKQQKFHRQSFLEPRKVVDKKIIPVRIEGTPEDIARKEESMNLAFNSGDTMIPKATRQSSPFYSALKTLLGDDAPIIGAAEKAAKRTRAHRGKSSDKPADKTQEQLAEHAKNQRRRNR